MSDIKRALMLPTRGVRSWIELRKMCHSKDTTYFLCSRGIGDTVLFCTLLSEYRKKISNKRISLIVSDRHADIVKYFDEFYDELILVNKRTIDRLNYNQLGRFYYKAHNFHYILPIMGISALGYREINLLDLFKIELGINPDVKPMIPMFESRDSNNDVVKIIKNFIETNNIVRGKSVILAPYSYSIKRTSLRFWNQLVEKLNCEGYTVITNIQKGEEPLPNTIAYDGRLNEICELAQYCGCVVSNRSGLCDLMALLKIKLFVVYPDGQSLARFTFKEMGLKADIKEYLFDNLKVEQLIHEIVIHKE